MSPRGTTAGGETVASASALFTSFSPLKEEKLEEDAVPIHTRILMTHTVHVHHTQTHMETHTHTHTKSSVITEAVYMPS